MAKPIIAKDAGGNFTIHPAGQYRLICADAYDEGERTGTFGTKHEVRLVFVSELINEKDEHKRPFEHSVWFRLSLNEKSNLRKFLEGWRGVPFTEKQIRDGWNVSQCIGANAFVQIIHKAKKDGSGGTKAEISTIMRLPKGLEKISIPKDFETIEQRMAKKAAANPQPAPAQTASGRMQHEDEDDFNRDEDPDDDPNNPLPF